MKENTKGMTLGEKALWVHNQLLAGIPIAFMGSGKNHVYEMIPDMYVENANNDRIKAVPDRNKEKWQQCFLSVDIPSNFKAVRASIHGYESGLHSHVVYMYTNSQFNRGFALLENGDKVDYDISIIDLSYYDFEVYKPEEKPVEMTMAEIEKKLGHKIKVIP